MARQVNVNIEIEGGVQITRHLGLKIEQELFNHHRFELFVPFEQLEARGEHFFNQSHRNVMGKKITVSFSPRLEDASWDFTFQGLITELRLQSLSDMNSCFVLKGYSPTIVLEDTVQRKSYLRCNIQNLFEQALAPYPQNLLRKQINPRHGGERDAFIQYNESNYEFLSRVADRFGEWFYYNGRELILGVVSGEEVDFMVDGLQNFDVAMVLRPSQFAFDRYNYMRDSSYTGQSSSQQVAGLTSLSSFVLDESDAIFAQTSHLHIPLAIGGQQAADEFALMEKSARVSEMIDFKGAGETPTISVGTVLNVKGNRMDAEGQRHEESYGKYRVTKICHQVNGSGSYQNKFEAVPESAQYPPRNPNVKQPTGQPELAEVIDNDDSENMGRVRVKFFWGHSNDQDQESYHLRVASFHTSEGKGANFVPEVGAQVMVGYEDNLAELPYVMSSLYPKKEGGPNYTSSNNKMKVIGTKKGNMVTWVDDDGNNRIQIHNAQHDETYIVLKFDDKEISIHAEGGQIKIKTNELSIDAGTVKVNASQKFEVEAGEISLKSTTGDVKIESAANTEIKANIEFNAEGTASAKIKGTMATVEADAMIEIKSSALTKVTGTPIMLN